MNISHREDQDFQMGIIRSELVASIPIYIYFYQANNSKFDPARFSTISIIYNQMQLF